MDYKDSVNSRFIDTCNQLIDSKKVVNKTQLAESLGIRSNKLSEILMGRMRAGVSEIQKICNLYGVSFDYIFNGNASPETDTPKLTHQNDTPKCNCDTPKRHTEAGKTPNCRIPEHDDTMHRNYHCATFVEAGGIPLIPIDAAAGVLSGDNVQVMDYECDHYVIPAFHGADFLMRVTGDSMTPRYMGGDLVACIRLTMVEFMQWNKSYIIDSTQGVLLKRVKRSEKPDHLLLISENENYDPFEIPTSEIRGLALVVGLIRIE